MFVARFRIPVLCVFLGLIAGCGGSSGGSGGGNGGGGSSLPTVVTFTVTGPTPTAIATRIGSGPFAAATLSSGAVTLSLPSGTTTFAVAYVCPPTAVTGSSSATQQADEFLVEASTADGASITASCPAASTPPTTTGPTGTLTGSVDATAIPGISNLWVQAWNGTTETVGYPPTTNSSFSFAASSGTDTVNVLGYNVALQGGYAEVLTLAAAKSFSNQTVPGALNGGSTVVLGASDQVIPEPITYTDVPSGFSTPTAQVSSYSPGLGGIFLTNSSGAQYPALPAGVAFSGGYYLFSASANGTINVTPYQVVGQQVEVNKTVAAAGPVTIDFPPAWSYTGPAAAPLPTFDLSYSGFSGSAAGYGLTELVWLGASTEYYLQVQATRSYLNGSTSVAVPDLTGLAGFFAAPVSRTTVIWSAALADSGTPWSQTGSSGQTVRMVANNGVYTVP